MPLTRQDVVAEGLALLDEVGLSGFTMRALATRLGTYPATVYWHVGDRDRVLALAVDHALEGITVPDPATLPWRPWLAAVAHEYRRVLHLHPNAAPIVASQVLISPPTLGLVEAILATLATAGFHGSELAIAYNTYVGSVVGWVSLELAVAPPGDWPSEFERALNDLTPTTHPTIVENREQLADAAFALRWHGGRDCPLNAAFEGAVTLWLDGLEAARRSPPRRDTP